MQRTVKGRRKAPAHSKARKEHGHIGFLPIHGSSGNANAADLPAGQAFHHCLHKVGKLLYMLKQGVGLAQATIPLLHKKHRFLFKNDAGCVSCRNGSGVAACINADCNWITHLPWGAHAQWCREYR